QTSRETRRVRWHRKTEDVLCTTKDREQPRVSVLQIKNRVIEAPLLRFLDIELDRRFASANEVVVAKGIGAGALSTGGGVDLLDDFVDGDQIAEPLAHLVGLAAAKQTHQLKKQNLEAVLR